MEVIVLQHIKIEDPGYIKDLMLNDGVNLTTIELDEGEKIPNDLSKFDAMFCMGGPMDTYMEDQYPWLIEEREKIKEFVVTLETLFRFLFRLSTAWGSCGRTSCQI
jgi:GMP synthase-like glutamine amidotransferase